MSEEEAKEFFEYFYFLNERKDAYTDAANRIDRKIKPLIETAQKYFDRGYGDLTEDIISRNVKFKVRMEEDGD